MAQQSRVLQLTYGGCEVCVGVQPLVAPPVGEVPHPECFVVGGGQQILAPGVPHDPCNIEIFTHSLIY